MRWNRSCTACKRRKIKCNRETPCGYCEQLGLSCTYLTPSPRASGANRVAKSATCVSREANERFDRIETALKSLESRLHEFEHVRARRTSHAGQHNESDIASAHAYLDSGDILSESPSTAAPCDQHAGTNARSPQGPAAISFSEDPSGEPLGSLRNSNQTYDWISHQPGSVNLQDLHPVRSHLLALWEVYKDSVEPLLKAIDTNIVESQILSAVGDLKSATYDVHALMFSIYYAAGTSMRYSVSHESMPFSERIGKFSRWERGIREALTRMNVLEFPTTTAVQALTIYLTCAQYHGRGPYVLAMSGILIRLAMKLGLHCRRSNAQSHEDEMKRRLWEAIVILDFDTSLTNDTDFLIQSELVDALVAVTFGNSYTSEDNASRAATAEAELPELDFAASRLRVIQRIRQSKLFINADEHSSGDTPRLHSYSVVDVILDDIDSRYSPDATSAEAINVFTAVACRAMVTRLKIKEMERSAQIRNDPQMDERLALLKNRYRDLQQHFQKHQRYKRWAWILEIDGILEFTENASQAQTSYKGTARII